jgi:hypothetical protein
MVHKVVLTAVLLTPAGLLAQLPDAPVTDVMSAKVYAGAVDAYAEGRYDAARAAMLRVVPAGVLEVARTTVPALAVGAATRPAGVEASDSTAAATRRWRAAAVLHLDVAWQLAGTYRADAVEPHVRAAHLALDQLRAAEGRTRSSTPISSVAARFRAQWQIAHLHYLTRSGQHDQFDRAAADIAPSDDHLAGALWFARGVSHETRARGSVPRVDRRSPARATAPLASATQAGTRRVWYASQLGAAAEAYRHVDAAHSDARPAQLRLGRTALELGDMDTASRVLRPLAQDDCPDAVCGLAWLFLGEWHERRADPAGARASYRRAHETEASRQAAAVAMLTIGEPAADVYLGGEASPAPASESWQAYVLGGSPAFAALRDALREHLR